MAGIMAKYFATSLAIEKVVSAPRVINSCLPISTTSISFVGLESRSTMLPASRAAWVPVFMATPTSACASAGASLVPSPHIATSLPLPCSSRISFSLSSGVACARKSSTPASAAIAAFNVIEDRLHRALADRGRPGVDAAHAGLRSEGHEGCGQLLHVAAAEAILFLGQHHDGAAFGGLIGERGKLRCIRQFLLG